MNLSEEIPSPHEARHARTLEGKRKHLQRLRQMHRIIKRRIRRTIEDIQSLEGPAPPKG